MVNGLNKVIQLTSDAARSPGTLIPEPVLRISEGKTKLIV